MSCYNPKKGFVVGLTENGKPRLRILDYKYQSIDARGVPSTMPGREESDTTSYFLIPCGHCLGCRQDQANQWTNRLIMESKYHDSTYFVTLTYDNDHLPVSYETDSSTGELKGGFTLSKRDCQLFFKQLRRDNPNDKIRYYLAGEYGPNTGRPHYHAIIFGLHISDLLPFGRSETGAQYFVSESLSNSWHRGFVSVEPANEYTIRYVTGYVTKKLGAYPNEKFEKEGLVPPFSLSSRKPGIGFNYLEEHKAEILERDCLVISTETGSLQSDIPRYFVKKLDDCGFEEWTQKRSAKRIRKSEDCEDAKRELTSLTTLEQLKVKEYDHEKRVRDRGKL